MITFVVAVLVVLVSVILGYEVTERATDDSDLAFIVALVVLLLGVAIFAGPWGRRFRG